MLLVLFVMIRMKLSEFEGRRVVKNDVIFVSVMLSVGDSKSEIGHVSLDSLALDTQCMIFGYMFSTCTFHESHIHCLSCYTLLIMFSLLIQYSLLKHLTKKKHITFRVTSRCPTIMKVVSGISHISPSPTQFTFH